MTTNWPDDPDDNDGNTSTGKDPVREQLKKLEKQNKELMEKLTVAEKAARTSTIKDVLNAKKLNPKLAKLIPSDVAATPEAIDTWLKEYEDLFPPDTSKTDNTGTKAGDDDSGKTDGDLQDEAYIEAMNAAARMAAVTAGGKAPASKPGELMARINDPALKPEDLLKLIEQHGGGRGIG